MSRLNDYEVSLLAAFVMHRLAPEVHVRLKSELPEVFNKLAGRRAVASIEVCFSCQYAPCRCPDANHAEAQYVTIALLWRGWHGSKLLIFQS